MYAHKASRGFIAGGEPSSINSSMRCVNWKVCKSTRFVQIRTMASVCTGEFAALDAR
jgi:hypothetical protein